MEIDELFQFWQTIVTEKELTPTMQKVRDTLEKEIIKAVDQLLSKES